jgi:phenylacetate-CoA ligase
MRLLATRGIRPARITDIEAFRSVAPVIGKSDVFASYPLADLLVERSLDGLETLVSSSGLTAQSFSLGMVDRKGTRSMIRSIDRFFDMQFQTRHKKTFVINTCAMGVTIPTSLPGINLSVRSDKALALLRALRPYYQQFIVTSDVYFLKKLLEEGRSARMHWSRWPVQFVMGGEWFPESYREYLTSLLQGDLRRGRLTTRILGSMGVAELEMNICFETHDTVRLRQLAAADERLRDALFGPVDTVPMIGHYDPRRWLIELTPTQDIGPDGGAFVFTNVDLDALMPLVRYRTGDCGYVLPFSRVTRILRSLQYDAYVPRLRYPLLAVAGRTDQSVTVAGKTIRMEFLRAVLYSKRTLASMTTGQFHATARGGRLLLHIQLQAATEPGLRATIQAQFSSLFNRHCPAVVRAVPFFDFRDVLSVDYERKFQHLVRET